MNRNNAQPAQPPASAQPDQQVRPPASAGPTQHCHGQRQPCTPAGPAQQQACPASAQPDKQVQHPAQQQRPARALRIVAGLALLALAAFITITGRAPC